jgi:hypothetical protein
VTPEQLLVAQADLLDRAVNVKQFLTIMAGIMGAQVQGNRDRATGNPGRIGLANAANGRSMGEGSYDYSSGDPVRGALVTAFPAAVRTAYAYRVSADMCTLMEHAASQLDETDRFDATLAPTGCGMIHFERSLPLRDARGKSMSVDWAVWGPASIVGGNVPGIAVYWFNDAVRSPDEYTRALASDWTPDIERLLRDLVGRWAFIGSDVIPDGKELGPAYTPLTSIEQLGILADGDQPVPHTNTHRYLHALFLLLNQTITVAEDEHVRRTALRAAWRMNLPGRVTVIKLRRAEYQRREGESLVHWSHRWVVRGHWRWQRCGVGSTERRRIWIHPHVKGPDGLPLVQSEKVYSLDR